MTCPHPAVVVQNPAHFGKLGSVITGLRCRSCGDSVRIELDAVRLPRYQQDVQRAMTRLTGSVQLARCEFVSIGGS